MLGRVDLRGKAPGRMPAAELSGLLPRADLDVSAAVDQVRPLCEDVRLRGAAAVREYTARFDGVELTSTVVPQLALSAALAGLRVLWVGVKCESAVAAGRELARADRVPGMARAQAAIVHEGARYDLEVDTSHAQAIECARIIAARIR